MAGQYQKAVDKALDQVGNPTAIIVTDVHSYADKVNSFAIDLAKKTGKPLALESISGKGAVAIQALERGEINNKEFVDLMAPDLSDPNENSPTAYLGLDRARGYYTDIAEAVKSGVKIAPLGTAVGYDTASLDPRYAPISDKLSVHEGQVDIDFVKFQRDGLGEKFERDPKKFFDSYYAGVKREFLEMSDENREKFSGRIERLNQVKQQEENGLFTKPDDYRMAVRDAFETLHPLSDVIESERNQLDKISEQYLLSNNDEILITRRGANKTISDMAANLVERNNGAIIVLGRDHTVVSETNGFDVDKGLRERGINTAIVDPIVPKDQQNPDFANPTERFMTNKLIEQNSRDIQKEGDPNRFTVELESGETRKIEQKLMGAQPTYRPEAM